MQRIEGVVHDGGQFEAMSKRKIQNRTSEYFFKLFMLIQHYQIKKIWST